jgi:hypothetical protein
MRRESGRRRLAVRAGDRDHPALEVAPAEFDLRDRADACLAHPAPDFGGRPDAGTHDDQVCRQDTLHIVSAGFRVDPLGREPLCGRRRYRPS